MHASLLRLIAICAAFAAVALAVPKFAPGLLAAYFRSDAAATATPATTVPATNTGPLAGRKLAIDAGPGGHFVTNAVIEGRTISVIVDTGATTVALTSDTARRLGIQLSPADYTARISTANGVVPAAPVTLSGISLGAIAVRNVPALVVPGNALEINLLGMTFLNRLTKFEVGGGQLVLIE